MLRAYSKTPADEFIAQLRTYVIAMGLSPQVVDCVDNLTGISEIEDAHAAEIEEAEKEAGNEGRKNMKEDIVGTINRWLEAQSNYDAIAEPCEAILALIEQIEV